MGYNTDQIVERFVRYAGLPHGKEQGAKPWTVRDRFPNGSGASLSYQIDRQQRVIGMRTYQMPMAHLVLTPSGKRKLWLLNGDRYAGPNGFARSNEQNDTMRMTVQATDDDWFIIPFSAVSEAGIDLETITPIHVEEESYTYTEHTARTLNNVPEHHRTHHVYLTADDEVVIAPHAPNGQEAHPDHEGGWYIGRRGLNGWENVPVEGPEYPNGYLRSTYVDITPGDDGLYHWMVQRHWLGGSLFRARYSYDVPGKWNRRKRWAYFVTSFDYNEPRPLWFMSELPRGVKPSTVAEAIEMLKPSSVITAETNTIPVMRQGDVFIINAEDISTRALTKAGATRVDPMRDGYRYVNDSHTATEVMRLPDGTLYVRGMMRHRPRNRRPDHQTIKLWDGKTWGRVAFNTVPRSIGYNGQDRGSRSWSRGGDVD
jgi:hypothetical protein